MSFQSYKSLILSYQFALIYNLKGSAICRPFLCVASSVLRLFSFAIFFRDFDYEDAASEFWRKLQTKKSSKKKSQLARLVFATSR